MSNYEELKKKVEELNPDLIKFDLGNNTAGTRVRKQLADIKRTCQKMRDEVQATRTVRKEEWKKKH